MEGKLPCYQVVKLPKIFYWSNVMPNNAQAYDIEIEEVDGTEDVGKDDFAFVIGPDGELKTFMIPEHLMEEAPEEVKMILALFGIDDIHELENRVLH